MWLDGALTNLHIDKCLEKKQKVRAEPLVKLNKNAMFRVSKSTPSSETQNSPSLTATPAPEFTAESNQEITAELSSANREMDFTLTHIDKVPGLWIIEDFIKEDEEIAIVRALDNDVCTPWKLSNFNGHCDSKAFGVRTQFGLPHEPRLVRKNDTTKGEFDIPFYLHPIMERLQYVAHCRKDLPQETRCFVPNECNANSYLKAKNHYLKPHYDDRALSGPILVNLSLQGRAKMNYSKPGTNVSVSVDLPRRCVQLISGPARWEFMHSIKMEDLIDERRVSVTWRSSGSKVSGVLPLPTTHSIAFQLKNQNAMLSAVSNEEPSLLT